MIKRINVAVKATSALLMHRFPLEPIEAIAKKTPEEQAEFAAYRDTDGTLIVPGGHIRAAMVNGGVYSKGKGRASLKKIIAACVQITPENISLGRKDYDIDSRRVVISATQGAIVRHRPRIEDWEIEFSIEYEDTLLEEKQVRRVLEDTFSLVGIMDFRPACSGPFGRGMITKWDAVAVAA